MGITAALGSAFLQMITFPTFVYMLIGMLIRIVFGFIPGIGWCCNGSSSALYLHHEPCFFNCPSSGNACKHSHIERKRAVVFASIKAGRKF